jgi:hypothetical protein
MTEVEFFYIVTSAASIMVFAVLILWIGDL